MLFIAFALGVVGVLVVLLHKSAFGRRLTALGDSPAACATLGVNPIITKLGVFVISAAIAGFAGALLGVFQGTATVQDFEMLQGLAYLLLLVVGGVAVVSGAVLGGSCFTLFTWLPTILPNWAWLTTFVNLAAAPRPRPRRHRDRPPALGHHPDGGRGPARPDTRANGPDARRSQPASRRRATHRRRLRHRRPPFPKHRSRRPARSPATELDRSGLELGLDLVGVLTQTRAGSHRHRLVEGHRRCRVQHLADDGVHLAHQVAG